MAAVTIPVFAKVRIGHFAEAQILQHIGVDMIDESEGLHFDERAWGSFIHIIFIHTRFRTMKIGTYSI